MRAIDSVVPIKKVKVKASCKPWFYSDIMSAIHKKGKLYSRYKRSGLETEKDKFKASKVFHQTMLHRKK